jgi:hypothetical protein
MMTENFPSFVAIKNLQIQEGEKTPNRINLKKFILRPIIIKLLKAKAKRGILKAAKGL